MLPQVKLILRSVELDIQEERGGEEADFMTSWREGERVRGGQGK